MAKNSYTTDSEFIEGMLNGSDEALRCLYKTHFPMVLQLVMTNSGSEDDAKDIYQESIIILYDKVKNGNFQLNSKLKTFIYSVCRRLWLKRLKHLSRNAGSVTDYQDYIPVEEEVESHEEKDLMIQLMESSLSKLGEPCKAIIEDYYMHNCSMQEICEKFGYTNADNAKTQKYKCMMRLKKLFFSERK